MMIGPFRGEYAFLSNFYEGKPIFYNGHYYKTAEHAFQASKARDPSDRLFIEASATPSLAKSRGRKIKLRPDWEAIKLEVMYDIIYAKFDQDISLSVRLLDTGSEELVEINSWGDRFWGQDLNGTGKNYLGKILMEVRSQHFAKHVIKI